MKIMQLVGTQYRLYRDLGHLKPFTEVSLGVQLLSHWDPDVFSDDSLVLVFSPDEECMLVAAAAPLCRGLTLNRGHGHIDDAEEVLFRWLAGQVGWEVSRVPSDGDMSQPISKVAKWSLALRIKC